MEPQDLTRSKHKFLGIYGWGGIGKTPLIGTQPNSLIIRPPQEHTDSIKTPENVKEMVVHGWAEMNEVLDFLAYKGKNFDWVWVDSWSSLQDTLLADVFADAVARKKERAKFGPDKGEYGINMQRISQWMRDVISMDTFNFGWTAWPHRGTILDDSGEEVELLLPWIQGNGMPLKMCGMMQVVGYYQIVKQGDKEVRVLRTRLSKNYFAADKFDAFKDGRLVSPTMPKIIEHIDAVRPKPKPARKRAGTTTARRRTRRTTTRKGS